MLLRLTVAVAAACVLGVCGRAEADVVSRLMVQRDYGVKLCGREFIRAVIFTCGGSRWRRATGGDSGAFQWSSLSDVAAGDGPRIWQSGAELAESLSPPRGVPPRSPADLLALYAAAGERQRQPLERSLPAALLGEQDAGSPDEPDDWAAAVKKKRNFSLGVAGMCCSQGCTKNDIGRLC